MVKNFFIIFVPLLSVFLFIHRETASSLRASHSYFLTSDGVRLHYLEAGKGKTVLFIPGWTMPADIWEKQIIYFSEGYHVVAFDPRSQGLSDIAPSGHNPERRARDIEELINHLGVDSLVMIGWSLGLSETLSYIKLFGQEKLAGVVLVDDTIGEGSAKKHKSAIGEQFKANRPQTTYRFVRSMFKKPHQESYYQYITEQSLKTPTEAASDLLINLYPEEVWRTTVHSIQLPLLYVVTALFREQAEILKRNKSGVWTEVFPSAGHALFVDEPDRFNRLLHQFLSEKVWKKN